MNTKKLNAMLCIILVIRLLLLFLSSYHSEIRQIDLVLRTLTDTYSNAIQDISMLAALICVEVYTRN